MSLTAEAGLPMSTRIHVLEGLVDDCVGALETLLACPDLNLDGLEPVTCEALTTAHRALHAVQVARARLAALAPVPNGPTVGRTAGARSEDPGPMPA